ncbi:hypothetical protein [Pelagibacterium lacus]|uniref:Uncharacterized protein n=1 Tax=Pelagibacterium lacus TaxID=2282655 RepID=A0A369W1Q6_9HYPH|nr:hypothetical protein [Pelagibacterium lacus]RDE08616.1 hypothetical protein DVH29_10665 [Pelagibacterium lacus]
MACKQPDDDRQKTVCGQAHAVLDTLSRTRGLPLRLSLSIEEILERAWELAYFRQRRNTVLPFVPREKSRRDDTAA